MRSAFITGSHCLLKSCDSLGSMVAKWQSVVDAQTPGDPPYTRDIEHFEIFSPLKYQGYRIFWNL